MTNEYPYKKGRIGAGRDGPLVKSNFRFPVPAPTRGSSQPPVTPVSGDPMPSGLHGNQANSACTYMQALIHTHKFFLKITIRGGFLWAWSLVSAILALRRLRQGDCHESQSGMGHGGGLL